jgi:DNA-binding NtrC family response regulator
VKAHDARPHPDLHREALRRVVEDAGHSRQTKANAYLSTFARQERLTKVTATVEQVREALDLASGNKSNAAAALGSSRQALYRILNAT